MPGGTGPASCASGEANQILGELAGVARRSALCQFSSLDSQDGPPQARTHVEGVAAARGDPRSPRVLPSRTLATCENIWPAGTSHAARVRLTAWRSRAENSGALRSRSSRIPSLNVQGRGSSPSPPRSPPGGRGSCLPRPGVLTLKFSDKWPSVAGPGARSPGPWLLRVAEAGDVNLVAPCEPASGLPGSVSRGARPRPRHVVRLRTSDSRHQY